MHALKSVLLGTALLLFVTSSAEMHACPFCSAVSQTLSQEIAGADVVVLARLVKLPPEADSSGDEPAPLDLDNPDSGMAEFEVVEALRGDEAPALGSIIKVVYFGSSERHKNFLISGIAGKQIDWTTPLPLSDRGIDYVKALGTLPEEGPERLAFFLNHLEDGDPLLAQDAYDEFARAPYEVVIAIGDQMDRQQLIGWIEDSQVGPTRRRLYLTMLGICGQAEDVAILESLLLYDYQQLKPGMTAALAVMAQTGPAFGTSVLSEMVKADVRRKQQCLDALIAAYLKLKGPEGLPLIEQRFLSNPAAEYTHVYAAVMALRFHGEETDTLPKARLLESVRLLLDNKDIADQVIPDLARWEDWSVLDRLVSMFKTSKADAWVRQPVISYLLAATDQEGQVGDKAEAALAELEELDPEGVKRAKSYMAFGLLARAGAKKKTTGASSEATVKPPKEASTTTETISESEGNIAKRSASDAPPVAPTAPGAPLAIADGANSPGPSRLLLLGGPLIAGLVLFLVFALLLRGADVRSSSNSKS